MLDAAVEVFARDGYEGASLRRIAEAAGIDIATLKYHVRDKPALFAEVYRDGFEHFQQALGPLLMRLIDFTVELVRGLVVPRLDAACRPA